MAVMEETVVPHLVPDMAQVKGTLTLSVTFQLPTVCLSLVGGINNVQLKITFTCLLRT